MLYTLRFFFSSKCSLFHNANLFGSCIIPILCTGVLKLKKKNNSGAKGLITNSFRITVLSDIMRRRFGWKVPTFRWEILHQSLEMEMETGYPQTLVPVYLATCRYIPHSTRRKSQMIHKHTWNHFFDRCGVNTLLGSECTGNEGKQSVTR